MDKIIEILVVGENSFIANALYNSKNPDFKVVKIGYDDFYSIDISGFDFVINCALNPWYKKSPYTINYDVDYEIINRAVSRGCRAIMLSSSKVYGYSEKLITYTEEDGYNPYDYHSENKTITEIILKQDFGDQVTILRGSNIFGYEFGRDSFMGYCMNDLINSGNIHINVDKHIYRDFLYVDDAVKIILEICRRKSKGTYNLSSCVPMRLDKFINNLLNGYGRSSKLIVDDTKKDRQFVLDNSKICKETDIRINVISKYDSIISDLGNKLLLEKK